MKHKTLIFFIIVILLVITSCKNQDIVPVNENQVTFTYDTLSIKPGKPGGYYRINKFGSDSILYSGVEKMWDKKGQLKISHYKYDSTKTLIYRVDSMFNKKDYLVELEIGLRDLNIQRFTFDSKGNIIYKDIFLKTDFRYVKYIRSMQNGSWEFSKVIDGYPPTRTYSSVSEFMEAEDRFNYLLFEANLKPFHFELN